MLDNLDTLYRTIQAVHPVDDEAWQALRACWTEVSYRRKQIITQAGETERYLYFVTGGVQRACFDHQGREATLVFSYPPSFSGIIDSFFTQTPSRFTLETITNSTLLRIGYSDMHKLMQQHRSIETWVRIATMQVLAGTLERQRELLLFSAGEKFTALLGRSPQVLQLIPHKYLASYIGVDPATFSKLLGNVRL